MARTANGRRKGDGRALFRALAADIRAELDAAPADFASVTLGEVTTPV